MEWLQRQKNILAQGKPATLSKNYDQFIAGIYPTHVDRAHSCYITDTNNNTYLDFICGLGALSLGYSNEAFQTAIRKQLLKGISYSLPHTLEIEVAELIHSIIPSMEKIRFMKNGDDVARASVRLARSYTGGKIILSNGYHGHSDIFTSLTEPAKGVSEEFMIYPLADNYIPQLDYNVAAVIIEALKLDMNNETKERIIAIREWCRKKGVVFIMDEIVTNSRVPKWTVSNMWQIDPDIILLGKGIANGMPLAVIGGKKDLMDSDYFVSTTFGGEALSLAACKATIHELHKRSFDDLLFYGKRLQDKLNTLHPSIQWQGYGTRAQLNTETVEAALFMQEMCKAKFLFGKAFFYNFAHLEEDVEGMTISAAQAVVEKMKQGRIKLEGDMPRQAFKR